MQVQNAAGQYVPYNIKPPPVTVNGTTYQPATCSGGACDPRGSGMNPLVSQLWNNYMPLPNDLTAGDAVNTQGYLSPIALPQRSNFAERAWITISATSGTSWRATVTTASTS